MTTDDKLANYVRVEEGSKFPVYVYDPDGRLVLVLTEEETRTLTATLSAALDYLNPKPVSFSRQWR